MPTPLHPPRPVRRIHSCAGFTLVELAVVGVIIGLLGSLALPTYQRIQRNSRFGVLNNDFRVFAGAFQQYVTANGSWPAYTTTTGTFPTGMQDYLRTSNWHTPTVFGGYYNWDATVTHNGRKVKAAIAIYGADGSPVHMTQAEMLTYDKRYDDGNLNTGSFQMGYQGCPLHVIEDDPAYVAASTPPAETTPPVEVVNPPVEAVPPPVVVDVPPADEQPVPDLPTQEEAAAVEAVVSETVNNPAVEVPKTLTQTEKATARYNDLLQRARQLSVKTPSSLREAMERLAKANTALQKTDLSSKQMDKNVRTYQQALIAANKALTRFEQTLVKSAGNK